MSERTNVALIRHLYAEIDKGNEAILDKVFAPDYVEHDPSSTPGSPPSLVGLKQEFQRFAAAFAESEHVIDDIFAAGDRVVVRITGRGIHRGEYLGVPPTGKRVSMSGIAIYRIAHGKIVEEWNQVDRLDFHRQLGLVR
ncbi:MAG TPA: ester cyclase [Thermoplasmata archaeon]|nr:ester cyclase [Thermoplasmata archaeon]